MLFKGKIFAEMLFVFLLTTFAVCNINVKFIFPLLIIISIIFICMIAISGIIKNKIVLKHILCIFAAMIISTGYYAVFYNIAEKPVLNHLDKYKDEEVKIKAKINKIDNYSFYTRLDLKITEIDNKKINYNFNLDLSVYETIHAGIDDIIETTVIFKAIEADDIIYNKSNGYFISADHVSLINADETDEDTEDDMPNWLSIFSNIKITQAESHSILYHLDRLQNSVKDIFISNIGFNKSNILQTTITQETALAYGIFTGRSNYIEPRVRTNFNRTGIAHIIAVSGLHMSIFSGIIFSFLNMLKIHKKLACVITIICCIFFMTFTGFSISVIRSGIMIILYYLAFLLSRKNDSVTALFFAVAIICLITPYNIINISFQLSFLATLGIVTMNSINTKIVAKIPTVSVIDSPLKMNFGTRLLIYLQKIFSSVVISLVSSILVTVFATIFTLPITSYSFKTLSLISPLINLIVSPLINFIFLFAFLLLAFSYIPLLSSVLFIFGEPLYFFNKVVLNIASWGSSLKYSCISVSSTKYDIFLALSVIFLILIVMFLIVYSDKKAVNIAFTAMISVCIILMCANLIYVRYIFKDSLRVAYYSENDNQSIILFHNDYEKADIIDMTYGYNRFVYDIHKIILDNGATNIGSVVLTHYHERHVQMLEKFMDYCNIDRVFVPVPKTAYDKKIFSMLSHFAVNDNNLHRKSYELFMYYDSIVILGNTSVMVNEFEDNKMKHMTVDIWRDNRKFLYLGIGYERVYRYIGYTYDVVFYGTHKHNRRDDDYSTSIYGLHYGVLSDYINNYKNKATQRLEQNVLEKYTLGNTQLIFSGNDENFYPVFEVTNDDLLFFSRKKSK